MRRSFKKFAAVSMAACMVVSTAACTKNDTKTTTEAATEATTAAPAATEAQTTAPTEAQTTAPTEAATEAPTDVATEAPTEAPTEATTEAPEKAPETDIDNVLIKIFDNVLSLKAYEAKYDIAVNLGSLLAEQGLDDAKVTMNTVVKANLENMNMYAMIAAALDSSAMNINADVLEISVTDTDTYVKTDLIASVLPLVGGADQIDQMLAAYQLPFKVSDVAEALNFSLPLGAEIVAGAKTDKLMEAYSVMLKKVINKIDISKAEVTDSSISFVLDGEAVYAIANAVANGIEKDDVQKVMDAMLDSMEGAVDFEKLASGLEKTADSVIAGLKAAGMELPEGIEEQIKSVINEQIKNGGESTGDMKEQMKASMEEAMEGFDDAIAEMKEELADKDAFLASFNDAEMPVIKITLALKGDKVTVSLATEVAVDDENKVTVDVNGEIVAADSFKAPKIEGANSIEKLAKIGAQLYQFYIAMTGDDEE